MSMARARLGGRGGAVGMKALRGCALGRRSARDPGVRQIRVARASERAARGAFAARGALARARCSAWDGGRSGRARSRKGQHAPHRVGGERRGKPGKLRHWDVQHNQAPWLMSCRRTLTIQIINDCTPSAPSAPQPFETFARLEGHSVSWETRNELTAIKLTLSTAE